MTRDPLDFHSVRIAHLPVHDALLNWARVVRVNIASGKPQPMFRHYKSTEIWISDAPKVPTDANAGWRMERAVSKLPEKHRAAIRWVYVFAWRPPGMVARRLGVTTTVLSQLVHDGRAMLSNQRL